MYFVYVLKNKEGKHYIGCTNDLNERLCDHNSNKNRSTKNKGPWHTIYFEKFNKKEKAFIREKQIKSYKGGEAFKKLIRRGGRVVECARLESVYIARYR
ncbi:MAG: GIY-YIG nuclease family protein, partial [Candidatus Saganbacteria bacterium]|nr:GIY-YIG nuclease family protein [Candidatus Saganbacteria bacterium]